MRVSVSKKAHQTLLLKVAAILQSDDPKDGLEHILNCWLAPSMPQMNSQPPIEKPDTDIEAITDW
ncbi:MAG: hypothetical protein LH702_28490 [Phormidesmis sp. CAN_BIN44]|nr:hypothetical protein [Phormidesmis sp. CAN_BIN44]